MLPHRDEALLLAAVAAVVIGAVCKLIFFCFFEKSNGIYEGKSTREDQVSQVVRLSKGSPTDH